MTNHARGSFRRLRVSFTHLAPQARERGDRALRERRKTVGREVASVAVGLPRSPPPHVVRPGPLSFLCRPRHSLRSAPEETDGEGTSRRDDMTRPLTSSLYIPFPSSSRPVPPAPKEEARQTKDEGNDE